MYNKEWEGRYPPIGPDIDFHVVQADDQGSFWNTRTADGALERVRDLAARENTFVVLFVHGWHHNASPKDQNMQDFYRSLQALNKTLHAPKRTEFRQHHTGSDAVRMVGIYVGWRGRTVPSLLDYFTFWGRKLCAERVGEGDVAEFILRLQRLYLRTNCSGTGDRYMGLVTIGHSFGGQVLWKSLQRGMEAALIERSSQMSNCLEPQTLAVNTIARVPADALGDLNVLLNPAFEAYQYARIDSLYRNITFPDTQVPQVVTFSANNDLARKFWFFAARIASLLARPFRPPFRKENGKYQRELYCQALGELPSQITHELRPAVAGSEDTLTQADLPTATDPSPKALASFDFTKHLVLSGVELRPVGGSAPTVKHSPVCVIKTTGNIIKGHNGIFRPAFREFLREYVAYVEAKRVLLWSARRGPASALSEGRAGGLSGLGRVSGSYASSATGDAGKAAVTGSSAPSGLKSAPQ